MIFYKSIAQFFFEAKKNQIAALVFLDKQRNTNKNKAVFYENYNKTWGKSLLYCNKTKLKQRKTKINSIYA